MLTWLRELDRILRGEATRLSSLRRGSIEVPTGGLAVVIAVLGAVQGVCMGSFSLFKAGGPGYWQVLASAAKVPALFFLTLMVTLPSLYVSNALVGSRLSLTAVWKLLIAAMGVTLAVLASLGPIVAFFSVITTSYPFMVLLNVLVFAASGFLGLGFLLQTLHRLSVVYRQALDPLPVSAEETFDTKEEAVAASPGALDRLDDRPAGKHVQTVFRVWVILFGLVGAQMGWVLRPFIGNPGEPFTWFRHRESNFFEAVIGAIRNLVS